MEKGILILENGEYFIGRLIGAKREEIGEVVFTTSMTGYQEILTDPSFAGQIVTFTYPLIGNYGVSLYDDEALKPAAAGLIMGEVTEEPSHYQSMKSFASHLEELNMTALTDIDTRSLVRLIRDQGTMLGGIYPFSGTEEELNKIRQVNQKRLEAYRSPFWVARVARKEITHYGSGDPHILLIDYGYKKSILGALLEEGCSVTVAPYSITYEEVLRINPDGILFSNGPGDPVELSPWFDEVKKMTMHLPSLGICLGHQVVALSHGAKTAKLPFGHRGANHPVKEMRTGKVWITPQNHGYVVLEESIDPDRFQVTYRNMNDQSIEGLRSLCYPIETVQFHPESHPGPTDTQFILTSFVERIRMGEKTYAFR